LFLAKDKTMSWLNNASSIASLIMAIFGMCGYLYGIVTYLRKKASPILKATVGSSQDFAYSQQKSSIRYRPLSWLEWMEAFGQGLVDTAEFVVTFLFNNSPDADFDTPIAKLWGCAFFGGLIAIVGGLIMGVIIAIFLGALGMSNPAGAATVIVFMLLFVFFSILYIYHVGLRVEMKQLEQFQEIKTH
jgi:uncharacterized membrane protein YfcA